MNIIKLDFKKDLTKLAGNNFGKQTYANQVSHIISKKPDDDYIIIIPERIDRIASSFIQGFFDSYIKNYGFSALANHISIQSSIKDINELINDSLE